MQTPTHITSMHVLTVLAKKADTAEHCLTLDQLETIIAGGLRKTIVKRMQFLIKRGYVKSVKVGCYALTPQGYKREMDGGAFKTGPKGKRLPQPVFRTSLRARLWRAMRLQKKFTISDLLQIAVKPEEKNARDTAHRLVSQLTRCGYVIKNRRRIRSLRNCSNGEVLYIFMRNTGSVCPIQKTIDGVRGLLDRNNQDFHPYEIAQPRPKALGSKAGGSKIVRGRQ